MAAFIPKRRSRGAWITGFVPMVASYLCLLALLLAAVFGPWIAEHVRWVS